MDISQTYRISEIAALNAETCVIFHDIAHGYRLDECDFDSEDTFTFTLFQSEREWDGERQCYRGYTGRYQIDGRSEDGTTMTVYLEPQMLAGLGLDRILESI